MSADRRRSRRSRSRQLERRFGDFVAVKGIDLDIARRRVLLADRPERLRQDDDAADDRRAGGAEQRPRAGARPRHDLGAGAPAAGQHRVPALRAVPAPGRVRERRLRAARAARSPKAEIRERVGAHARAGRADAAASGRGRASSPAASSSAWRWPARSCWSREVLLLDEPLGALDLKLRRQMQVVLKRLQREIGITFVYVTHDQEEAFSMSDRVGIMNAGCLEQLGPPREVYHRPRTLFVADFVGASNRFPATVLERPGGRPLRADLGPLGRGRGGRRRTGCERARQAVAIVRPEVDARRTAMARVGRQRRRHRRRLPGRRRCSTRSTPASWAG